MSLYGDEEGVHAQEVADLKRMSLAEQDKLLRDIQIKGTVPADGTAPAIKADLKLPR